MLSCATQHHAFAGKLLSERDRAHSDRESSRKRYFDACETLESARQKKAQAKDDRQGELHDTYSLASALHPRGKISRLTLHPLSQPRRRPNPTTSPRRT